MPSRKALCRESQDRVGTDFVSSFTNTANSTSGLFKPSIKICANCEPRQVVAQLEQFPAGGEV